MAEPLTVEQVAQHLRTGRDAVTYAIEMKRLRAARFGVGTQTRYEIAAAELRRFLAASVPAEIERPPMSGLPKLYTLPEVAEMSEGKLRLRWLQDQVRAKKVPHLRPGRTPLMTEDDIAATLQYARQSLPVDPDVRDELERRSRGRQATRRAA